MDGPAPGRTIAWLTEEINPRKTESIRPLGAVDISAVRDAILAIPDSGWDTADDFAANYNKRGALRSTAHVVFRFCDRRRQPCPVFDLPAWEPWASRLQPILEAAAAPFGYARGFFPRIMLAKLPAGAFIAPHVDGEPRFTRAHKVHVPIATNPGAVFFVGDQRHHLAEGYAYEVNNGGRHGVANGGSTDRIHLIFEYLDGDLQTFASGPDQ